MAIQTNETCEQLLGILIEQFAETAAQRDQTGGTAKEQRDLIRQSGLLRLMSPQNVGGYEKDWPTVLRFVKEIANVDSSLAHLFGYHFLCLASVELFGTSQQVAHFHRLTAEKNYFWGNTFNPLDQHVKAVKAENGWYVTGRKSFCSGASDSDLLLISAQKEDASGVLIAVVPTNRKGIHVLNDWDSFGQRQTDSGTVDFEQLFVHEEEVLGAYEADDSNVFATIRTHIAQSILVHVLLGTAEGAFEAAKQYTQQHARAWVTANVKEATDDPYTLHHYGDWFVRLKASNALAEIATNVLQSTWQAKHHVTMQQRGECSIAVATAKVQVAQTALDVTSGIFQVMGARATSAKFNFDRYWRNVRTHTLHDPIDYKYRDIGQYALKNQYPEVSAYS